MAVAGAIPRTEDAARPMSSAEKRVIFASSLGTVFEWYDFYLYGSLAAIIGAQFFSAYPPATRDIFPGKIIQYLACGRATVATPPIDRIACASATIGIDTRARTGASAIADSGSDAQASPTIASSGRRSCRSRTS